MVPVKAQPVPIQIQSQIKREVGGCRGGEDGELLTSPKLLRNAAERLGTALGRSSTGSLSELAVELLPLSLSSEPSLSKTSPSSKPS